MVDGARKVCVLCPVGTSLKGNMKKLGREIKKDEEFYTAQYAENVKKTPDSPEFKVFMDKSADDFLNSPEFEKNKENGVF